MKRITCLFFITILACTSACRKDQKDNVKSNASVPGKWRVAGNWLSSGGPMYYIPAADITYVEFNTDGTLSGSGFPDYKFYAIKDSITIKMTKADETTFEDFRYRIKGDTLTMSPSGPLFCIEGCSTTLVKD